MKQKTRILIYILVGAAVVVMGVLGMLAARGGGSGSSGRSIDLGQKYLVELSYDKAVIAFTEAIDIDPTNIDAYKGIAQAYEGMGDTEKAIEWLRKGYDLTGDSSLKAELDRLMLAVPDETEPQDTTPPQTEQVIAMVNVPDFGGLSEEEVKNKADELGLNVEIKRENSDTAAKGTVIGQDVPAGAEIAENGKVVVIISDGKPMTEVPKLIGLTKAEAEKLCADAGLNSVFDYTDSAEKVDTVLSQSVPAKASIPVGSTVKVGLSSGKPKPKYTAELIEAYTQTYDYENGDYKKKINYTLKSEYNFDNDDVMAKYGVEYPYICRHGLGEREEVPYHNDNPIYDYDYDGEIYYSIETGTSSIKLSTRYYYISQFSDGLAFFKRDYKESKKYDTHVRGYLNTKGEEVFSYLYTTSSFEGCDGSECDMHYGYAAYSDNYNDGVGVVDSKGNIIIKPAYYSVNVAGDGIFRVESYLGSFDYKYGYINAKGKIIAKCEYDVAGEFINGLAAVGYHYFDEEYGTYTKKGVINTNGELVVPCKYDYCLIEDNGLIVAFNSEVNRETYEEKNDYYCFDKNGRLIFDKSYTAILTGNNTGCGHTLGEANDRILAQGNDGMVYLYDLNGKLIGKTKGKLQYTAMLHGGGGSGPWAFLFDITGIVWLGENTYMDKEGNVYTEHPYGLPIGKKYDEDSLATYYTSCTPISGYDNIYKIVSEYENSYCYYYKITPNK